MLQDELMHFAYNRKELTSTDCELFYLNNIMPLCEKHHTTLNVFYVRVGM